MSEIKRTDVRFNLSRDEDRRAWEFLNTAGGKYNRLIIQAINAYADKEKREAWEKTFLERIDYSIRDSVHTALKNAVLPAPAPESAEDTQSDLSQQENDEVMFAFLDGFDL